MQSRNFAYNPALDHLRCVAALLVFLFHAFHTYAGGWRAYPDMPYLGLVTEGHTGVSLFFTLSGFLFMQIALQSEAIDYRTFLRNRILRVAPLFLFVFFIAISIGRDDFAPQDALYVLFSNLGEAPTSDFFMTGAAWSISVEFTFYLIFPFLARFAKERGARYLVELIVILIVVKIAAYALSDNPTHMLFSTLVGRLDQFLTGMLAAMLHARLAPSRALSRQIFLAGAVAIVFMVGVQAHVASFFDMAQKQPFWVWWGTVEALCWAACIMGYADARIEWPKPLSRLLQRGGEISYSIYLMHGVVIAALHSYLGTLLASWGAAPALIVNTVLALAGTWLLAGLTFRAIERPFLDMRGRYVEQRAADRVETG